MKYLLIAFFMAALSVYGSNLLQNSSFEKIDESKNIPESWGIVKRGILHDTHSVESSVALDGKNSARIENPTNITKGASLIWMQSNLGEKLNAIAPGTDMEFSVYIRAIEKNATARVYFEAMKAKKLYLRDVKCSADKWTKVIMRFTKEDVNYGSPYVCLQLLNGKGILFDCAYFGPVGKNPWAAKIDGENFIVNGNIEAVKGSVVDSWNVIDRSKSGGTFVSETAASGKYALQLKSAAAPRGMLAWYQTVDSAKLQSVAPGTEMVIRMKAKTDKPSTVFRFYIEFMQKHKFIGTFIAHNQKCAKDWEEKTFTFKMPAAYPDNANIYLQLMSAGQVFIDDISIQKK